jgi:ubiquitin interaction motif-containing protein
MAALSDSEDEDLKLAIALSLQTENETPEVEESIQTEKLGSSRTFSKAPNI